MQKFTAPRKAVRLSIAALAQKAKVSRYRLWESEQGLRALTPDEEMRIRLALRAEAARLEGVFRALDAADSAA